MIKLYHYVHCPFCVRVRMALGHLKLSYKSIVLPYDDEETPLKLTGVKMLPILERDEIVMNESLDIIQFLDENNSLQADLLNDPKTKEDVENLLTAIGSEVHSLAMPYWIYTKEFNDTSRVYFQSKKEKKRGPFAELMKRKAEFIENLNSILESLEGKIAPFYQGSQNLTILDIMIASHLWGMYVVPEFQFSPAMHEYLQRVAVETSFDYHGDFVNWPS